MSESIAMNRFVINLRRVMREKNIMQADLAEVLGVTPPVISRLLSGREGITIERAERIAIAVGVPLSEMLSEKFCGIVKQPA